VTRRPGLALALPATLTVLAGCVHLARGPEERYFVLRAVAEPAPAPAGARPETLLGLLPVRVPAALARAQLVSVTAPGELRLDPLRRWAEPLDEGVTRTLAENLAVLLPRHRVLRSPWPAAATLRARAVVDLRAFGPQADGAVRLEGSFTLLEAREERALARETFTLASPAGPAGGREAVEAMSALVADLARRVASAVEALPAPSAP
jgi:uncharacterized lipoprotein YmbA